jgi:inorganic pyrophosphatase/exopolyphosphatase
MVGSCGTLIWEQFKKRGKGRDISKTSAKLLLASIVSNNLAFKSPLTTERDGLAYAELSIVTGLSGDWVAEYFQEQEGILFSDFEHYVRADIKVFKIANGQFAIGQIEMWNADNLLNTKKVQLRDIMSELEPIPWVVNILNISRGFNYVYSNSLSGKEIFEQKFNLKFDGNIAKTDSLLMRKYLIKVLRE